jgi:hypothetical protein
MAAPRSLAERYRAHRVAFLLAQELGCTPKEAEHELKRRQARDRWEDSRRRLAAKMAEPPRLRPIAGAPDDEAPRERWMMRD